MSMNPLTVHWPSFAETYSSSPDTKRARVSENSILLRFASSLVMALPILTSLNYFTEMFYFLQITQRFISEFIFGDELPA
jgi:hypothetical protein